eukprot:3509491-Ditylum_brightwellii.AAC.1
MVLKKIYETHNIDLILCILVNSSLAARDTHSTLENYPCLDWSPYQQLIHSQSLVGWEQIYYGRFTKEWGQLQYCYLQLTNQKAPGDRACYWDT